jgi:O-antigen/teichoic acid export membrane protein
MVSKPQGVFSSFLHLLSGSVAVQLINLGYLTYAAVAIGPAEIGIFFYVMAIYTILLVVTNFGRIRIITREAAVADEQRRARIVDEALLHQVFMSLLLGSLFLGWTYLEPALLTPWGLEAQLAESRWAVLLASVALVASSPGLVFDGYFLGTQQVQLRTRGLLVQAIVKATVGGSLLLLIPWLLADPEARPPVEVLFGAQATASTAWSTISLWFYFRDTRRLPRPRMRGETRTLVRHGAPLAAGQLGSVAFNRFDWIFLMHAASEKVLGLYGLAYRLFEVINLVTGQVALAVFPHFCKHEAAGDLAAEQLRLVLRIVFVPGCLLIGASWWWAENLTELIGQGYEGIGFLLALLSLSLPFHGGCGIFYHLSIARGRQALIVITSPIAVTLNVTGCLILIPQFQAAGAAWAMLIPSIAQFFMLSFVARELRQAVVGIPFIALAAGLVWLIGWLFYWLGTPWWLGGIVTPIAGGAAILALAFGRDERRLLLQYAQRLKILKGRPAAARSVS